MKNRRRAIQHAFNRRNINRVMIYLTRKRFERQKNTPATARQQCRQLLLNDWENNLPVTDNASSHVDVMAKWRELGRIFPEVYG